VHVHLDPSVCSHYDVRPALVEEPAPVDPDRLADEVATVVLRYLPGGESRTAST
jgi:hypothetical protein